MIFIFWQGIISIHQQAFLEALAVRQGVAKVILVVENDITAYRKNMGWTPPEIAGIDLVVSPGKDEIRRIVTNFPTAVHVFGGIRVGKMMGMATSLCIRGHRRIGIMTEPYDPSGLKGWLRYFKYQWYHLLYFRHIQFVLAVGRQGVAQFRSLGYNPQRLFAWAYFISVPPAALPSYPVSVQKIIYAGRLEESKGIYRFLSLLLAAGTGSFEIDLFGEGSDESRIRELIALHKADDRVHLFPFVPHDQLLSRFPDYHWVVLPSTQKDGWGVIVSEGLLMGLKAICSSICGVSWAVKNGFNGLVFDWNDERSCPKAIHSMLSDKTFAPPEVIKAHATRAINGQAGAEYFLSIMNNVFYNGNRPDVPWEQGDLSQTAER